MAIRIYETPEGPTIKKDVADYRFTIEGTTSEASARTMLLATTPACVIVSGKLLVRKDASIDLGEGPDVWDGAVTYGEKQDKPDTGDHTYQFDTGGGTQHTATSLATVAKYAPPGKTAPDCKGAIGWDGENVAGVDVQLPQYHFSESHTLSVGLVTGAYKATLFALTGTVNEAPFKNFKRGEVLFLGAGGNQRNEEAWSLTFKWAASPEVLNLHIADIVVEKKEGWHYLWVLFGKKADVAAKAVIPAPKAVYIEQVYAYSDFSLLGVGV